ncbi:ArnT family glycosyltransferase [Chitinolyticbacter albus]|uniref:ArnT family glycosyltransferase n=1 Tax=Chitinolyticbacter albus TaxID=2961951 RepID=UPI0021098BE2|nr:hypothetical protein [Chitinolyticbacter albus]
MLTYVPQSATPAPEIPQQKPWLLIVLCLVWLLPGLIGHDPWKPAELETAAVVKRFVEQDYWVLPRFADVSYLEFAPLYYWSAAIIAWPLSKLGLPIHDAARLATGVWMALALWGLGLAGRALYGRRQGRVGVLVLIGCIGLIIWGHQLAPQVLTVAAFSWHAFALAHSQRQPLLAGAILGLAWLTLLLGTNWADFLLALSSALILIVFKPWRRASYAVTLVTALVLALPLVAVWALWLHQFSPAALSRWLDYEALGPFGGLAQLTLFHGLGFFLSTVIWFAWPALPLAAWGGWSSRRQWREPGVILPASMAALMVLWLAAAGDVRDYVLLPLLVPLSLLAVPGVDVLRRGAASALNWFGMMTFGLTAAALWLAWGALQLGLSSGVTRRLAQFNPDGTREIAWLGLLFALAISVSWYRVIARKRPLGRLAVTNWACGATLVWGVLIGLWLPWLDQSKSYRGVSDSLVVAMQGRAGCIDVSQVATAMVVSLDYFSTLPVHRNQARNCRWQLHQGKVPPGVMTVWNDTRRGDEAKERFYLLDRGER